MAEKTERPKKILIISSDKNLRDVLGFCFGGWGYDVILLDSMVREVAPIKKISPDVIVIDVHAAKRTDLEICGLLKSDFITAYIPVITLINKRRLRGQLLSIKYGIDDYLIKPPDPLDLRVRVEMAIKRLQHSFYSTPLTGLPGGKLIEENLRERLNSGKPFSFGYLDIDNFKYFNDIYGYLQGDRFIMHAAYILYMTIQKFGGKDDFIGHIGGDDFAFITTPHNHAAICQNFIAAYDTTMLFHYNKEDRLRGHLVARARDRRMVNIPLVGVSIAVVNSDEAGQFKNIIEINERIADIKHYLKSFAGSKYMADRRICPKDAHPSPHIFKSDNGISLNYHPLGQILLGQKKITADMLDDALTTHWKRGIRLGDVLTQMNLVNDSDVEEALNEQRAFSRGVCNVS